MSNLSFRAFLNYAQRLHDQAREAPNHHTALPYLIGSILSAWISIESFVNNMLQDYAALPPNTFSVHERAFLEEKQVQFTRSGKDAGRFIMNKTPEFKRLEDKIMFLIAKFGGGNLDKGGQLWQKFERVKKKRNTLSHYRRDSDIQLQEKDSKEAIELVRELIEFLSKRIWNRRVTW